MAKQETDQNALTITVGDREVKAKREPDGRIVPAKLTKVFVVQDEHDPRKVKIVEAVLIGQTKGTVFRVDVALGKKGAVVYDDQVYLTRAAAVKAFRAECDYEVRNAKQVIRDAKTAEKFLETFNQSIQRLSDAA